MNKNNKMKIKRKKIKNNKTIKLNKKIKIQIINRKN